MVQISITRISGEKPPMSEDEAAEKIQASFRGYKTRKTLKDNGQLPNSRSTEEVKDEKTEEETEKAEDTDAKPCSALFADPSELLDIDLTDVDLEKAAAKIQASYRNFSAKKKQVEEAIDNLQEAMENQEEQPAESAENETTENETTETSPETQPGEQNEAKSNEEEEENLEDIDLGDPALEHAALKIQSTFRGFKSRRGQDPTEEDAAAAPAEETEAPMANGEKGEDEE